LSYRPRLREPNELVELTWYFVGVGGEKKGGRGANFMADIATSRAVMGTRLGTGKRCRGGRGGGGGESIAEIRWEAPDEPSRDSLFPCSFTKALTALSEPILRN